MINLQKALNLMLNSQQLLMQKYKDKATVTGKVAFPSLSSAVKADFSAVLFRRN